MFSPPLCGGWPISLSLQIQAPVRQQPKVQTTPPPAVQGQKSGSLTPPSSPKTQRTGHRRILSDVTHSAVFGVPASKSTQLLQAAAAEASLNKSKYVVLPLYSSYICTQGCYRLFLCEPLPVNVAICKHV